MIHMNLFNQYDTQIVSVGSSSSSASSNSGTIYLNNASTYLCCDTESSPTKFVSFAVDTSNKVATETYKSGSYSSDAIVSVTSGSGVNQGLYNINCGTLKQTGTISTLVNSSSSIFNLSGNTVSSYIQHNNPNLYYNNTVSTQYKADMQRTNIADATVTVYPLSSLSLTPQENQGRFCVNASTFEPAANMIQTGSYSKLCSSTNGYSYINHINTNSSLFTNTVSTLYKSDPTSSVVSDAAITVFKNPLTSFLSPSTNGATLQISAGTILIGNTLSTVSIPGTLVITYFDSLNISHSITLGKYLSQTSRTRL